MKRDIASYQMRLQQVVQVKLPDDPSLPKPHD